MQDGGSLFNIYNSHSLGEIALKGLANTGEFLGRKAFASAIKSDTVKRGEQKRRNQIP